VQWVVSIHLLYEVRDLPVDFLRPAIQLSWDSIGILDASSLDVAVMDIVVGVSSLA
jgi:hypothetical protein